MALPKPPSLPPAQALVESVVTGEIPPPDVVLRSLSRFNPWERPLPKEVAPPPPPPPPLEETVVVSELALDLIGTMLLPGDASWATLVRRNSRSKQISLRLGEEVDGAILERIARKAVFLRNHGRLEKLSMLGSKDKGMENRSTGAPVTGAKKLSRKVYDRLLSKGMGLLAGVNITPFYQGANSVGYRLKFPKNNADMRQFGLVNGDVVKKVNGISVLDGSKLTGFAPKLKGQSSLSIEVLRNNRPETIQLKIVQ